MSDLANIRSIAEEILRTWCAEGTPPKPRHVASYLSEIRGVVVTVDEARAWLAAAERGEQP